MLTKLSVEQSLIKANSHTKKGEVVEAQIIYKEILKTFSKNQRALQGLAALNNLKQNNTKKKPPQKVLNQIVNYYNQGQFSALIKHTKTLVEEYPNEFILWSIMGASFAQIGNLDKSIHAYKEALLIKPDYVDAYNNIGVALKDKGMLDEAIQAFKKFLALKPNDAGGYNNIGTALNTQGKFNKALESFKKAISLKPDYAKAYYNIGNTLNYQGKFDEAIEAFKKAISLKPNYAKSYKNMGSSLQSLGKIGDAIKAYNKAISILPNYAEAYINLAVAYKDQGNLEDAIEACNKSISIKPNYVDAHYTLGITLQELGRFNKSAESYRKTILLNPNYAEAYASLAGLLKKFKMFKEAEINYRRAIELKPEYFKFHYNFGVALKEFGRFEEAEAYFRKAIMLKPDDGEAKHILASLVGETTLTAPRDYVENLFDKYAYKFEESLVKKLEYKIPNLIAKIITRDSKSELLGSIIDLGCGTGLFGKEINRLCQHLEGVDISQKMLDKAKEKNVYNNLIKQDILDYLSSANLNFNYFVLIDVLIYIGDLSEIFSLIKSRNQTNGKLVFSTEDYSGNGFFLEQSGRYSHSKIYIEDLCKKYGYEIQHFEIQRLRKEKNQYIKGGLYVLNF